MNRRTMLKAVALAGVTAIPATTKTLGQTPSNSDTNSGIKQSVLRYLATLARTDGGFAWEDQEQSHLTPSFAAIGCYHALRETPSNRSELVRFIRTHHPSQLKKLEQEHRVFDFQQIQSLTWLGERRDDFRDTVRGWKRPVAYLKQYEQHGYPVFQSEMAALVCRPLVGLPPGDLAPQLLDYLNSRRRPNGSFNNTPATDGGDGHVMNTWWGLRALHALENKVEEPDGVIAWLRTCQLPSGGFTFSPKPEFGGVDDAGYTWAAVRALKSLGSVPANRESCVAYLTSLANTDGGFADRPRWLSNPLATYYVLDALSALDVAVGGSLELERNVAAVTLNNLRFATPLPSNLKVFTIQLEAPGQGSPSDAVNLAAALKIHLWGAKNAKSKWIARAQSLADERKTSVNFFVANEEYGTWVNVPGLGTYSHMSDVIAPAGHEIGAPLAGAHDSREAIVTWPEFRERRFAPLHQYGGRLVWQFGENEELVRMVLDDSLQRGGFSAISTFHFGNPDFMNTEPFLQRWRGQIPFVALQDAHASEPWWGSDVLTSFRTVFLATEPSWENWLTALKNNLVVAIRHDAASGYKTWMRGGSREVLDFVRDREKEWRWWSEPRTIVRPWATCAVLQSGDPFEAGAPSEGIALRLRCWWDCTIHGVLKRPFVELVRLTIDGKQVATRVVETKSPRGERADHYYLAPLQPIDNHDAVAVATLRRLSDGKEVEMNFPLYPSTS